MNVDIDTFAKSQQALREYMYYKSGSASIHRARVLVSSNGELKFSAEMSILPRIGTNETAVSIIAASNEFERDYYLKYSNKYQAFSFVSGTLRIKGTDIWGNSIEINITAI